MESNLFSSREVRDVREVFFWIGSTAFAHFADFARGIDSYPFRVFGVFRGLFFFVQPVLHLPLISG